MHTTPEILEQPVKRAARVVALILLDNATKARQQLEDASDADGLHDFRVAVRRLRSWLRALGPWLEDSIPKKAFRRLEKAARLTGDSRDAEVHLAWLSAQRGALSVRQRRGLAWLVEQIEQDKKESDHVVMTKGARAFDRARDAFAAKLPIYRAHVDDTESGFERTFGAVVAELLRDHAVTLAERLTRVEAFDDEKGAHAARIAGKRLRYLLEPIAEHVEGASELVSDLSKLQDTLGDWHDVHVFSNAIVRASESAAAAEGRRVSEAVVEGADARRALRTDRQHQIRLGLLALASRLHERGQGAFTEAKEKWLGAGAMFVARVESVSDALVEQSSRGKEIERKYLLRELPTLPDDATAVEIDQGYLPGTQLRERLRRVRAPGGDTLRHVRTMKIGEGLVRSEFEEEISADLFARMWPLTEGQRLRKRRYVARGERHSWEIDEFLDRDLVLAEVELRSADEEVALPEWLTEVLDREVTGDRAYDNATLASGDGSFTKQAEKELDEEHAGKGRGHHSADDARIAHEPRLPSLPEWRREQPTVGEPPGT